MARRVKTLFNNPNERSHRDHRSKKNRIPLSKIEIENNTRFKRKKEKLKAQEADKQISDLDIKN